MSKKFIDSDALDSFAKKFNEKISEDLKTKADKTEYPTILDWETDIVVDTRYKHGDIRRYGINGDGVTDVTAALQNVLNNNDNVFIPDGVYMINGAAINDVRSDNPDSGLVLHSNQKLLLSDNAILKLIPCATKNSCVLRIESGCENVEIEGGNIEGDKYEHLGTTGEAGMGIYLSGNKNVVIKNINISKCWGDGLIVNNSKNVGDYANTELKQVSENIYAYNVICNDNRRQGMTIVGVDGAVFENCKFTNTGGTNPQAGVDIEPSPYAVKHAKNIEFINCEFSGNARSGIIIAINDNNGDPTIIENIKLKNCTLVDNKESGILVTSGVKNVEVNNCYVARNEINGVDIASAVNCTVTETISEYNNEHGIYFYNTNGCTVVNSYSNYNGKQGIRINTGTNEIRLFNNVTVGNTENNIQIIESRNCIISHNTSIDSGIHGMLIHDSSEIITDSNFIKDSMEVGLYLLNVDRSKIYNNIVIGSSILTDQGLPNIICVGDNNSITENTSRIGSNTNRPSGGLSIGWYGSESTNNYVFNNDCYNSGCSFGLKDMGINTLLSTNIDLNGGIVNIHQTKEDEALNTTDKTIVGAINEIKEFTKAIDAIKLNGYSLWVGTTAELENIGEKDPNTIYFEIDNAEDSESNIDANEIITAVFGSDYIIN